MDSEKLHALACRYAEERSEEALGEALDCALPLCGLIARRFSGRGVEYEDLFQVACLACVSALERFDSRMDLKFITYAAATITGKCRNEIRDRREMLHASRGIREQAAQFRKARQDWLLLHHGEPSAREMAQIMNWPLDRVLEVLSYQNTASVSSLDETDAEGLSLAEKVPFPEDGFEKAEQREDLRNALEKLDETGRTLLCWRFEKKLSQRETAGKMDLSQMQVSRMERRVLLALKKEMEKNGEDSAKV